MATKDFVKKIEAALDNLVTLNVITAVGATQIEVSQVEGKEVRNIKVAPDAKVIWTSVDLLQGDITTTIHPDFQGDGGQIVRNIHNDARTQGMEIIKTNVGVLKDLLGLLGDAYKSLKERPQGLE